MQAHDITFPSTIGHVVTTVRGGLEQFAPVTVQPKLPPTKIARMVTIADDGGTARSGTLRRRYRANVWADDPVTAERLAIAVAATFRGTLRMLDVTDPLEVTDTTDDVIVVGKKTLTHYLITGTLIVRAWNL